jgi:hypothetical protein
MNRRLALVAVMLCACVIPMACSGNADRPQLAQASGTVLYKGQPLSQGTIVFHPETGRGASGKIVEGEIVEVTTYEVGDGVPVGKHKVTIQSVDKPDADMYTPTTSLIPEKYNVLSQTDLTADITAGENGLEFELKD